MIKTYTGPMHSGKSSAMIVDYYKIWNKEHVRVFKPVTDTRDSGEMKSKDFETKEGVKSDEIYF